MKKLLVLMLMLFLCGCGAQESFETVSDEMVLPVLAQPREILLTKQQWQEMQYRQNMSTAAPEEFPYEGDAVAQPSDRPPFDE